MPTQAEIRRAIMWADKYLDRLFRKFTWYNPDLGTTRTYAVLASHPSVRVAIKVNKQIPFCYRGVTKWQDYWQPGDYLIGGGDQCDPIFGPGITDGFFCTVKTRSGSTPERWLGEYVFQLNGDYGPPWDYHYIIGVIHVEVTYEPAPDDDTRMQLTVERVWTEKDWSDTTEEPKVEVAVCVNEEPVITGIKGKLKEPVEWIVNKTIKVSDPYGCFPSAQYSFKSDVNFAAYYYWYDRPSLRTDRAIPIFTLLDDFAMKPLAIGVLYRQTDNEPDDWTCKIKDIYWDCPSFWWSPFPELAGGVLDKLPRFFGFYPHISRCCYCRDLCRANFTCFPSEGNIHWVASRAIHLMNKYGDPTRKEDIGGYVRMYGCLNSAEDYLLNGYKEYVDGKCHWHPGLLTRWEMGKGFLRGEVDGVKVYSLSPFLFVAATELGYGFGYSQAKTVADDMADILIKVQWGYPFTQPWYGRIHGYGLAKRPDHTGGFMHTWAWEDGYPAFAGIPSAWYNWVFQLLEMEAQPPEAAMSTPTWAEYTKLIARALRIYDAYKFRLGGS